MDTTATGFVVYDDHCRLCTAWLNFVLRRNKQEILIFVPVGSWIGARLLAAAGMTTNNYDSMVYAQAPAIYLRSEAIVRILTTLGGPWRLAKVLLWVPERWRDHAYTILANNRYRWFGKHRTCECANRRRPKQYVGHHVL